MSEERAWVFGDDVNTDLIAPARFIKRPIAEQAAHSMEAVEPAFASSVRAGDVVVGGESFGCGSSREQAPEVLRHLGIAAVVAKSFARTFYRNAMNLGLPALVCARAGDIRKGARLRVALDKGLIEELDRGEQFCFEPIPAHLLEMIRDGGLIPHLERRLKARTTNGSAT